MNWAFLATTASAAFLWQAQFLHEVLALVLLQICRWEYFHWPRGHCANVQAYWCNWQVHIVKDADRL